jgi:hypothetical protein
MIDRAYRHNAKDCAHGVFVARDDHGLGEGTPHLLGPSLRVFWPNAPPATVAPLSESSAILVICFERGMGTRRPMQPNAKQCGMEPSAAHDATAGVLQAA